MGPTKNQTSSPTGWLCRHVWRMSLRRKKSAIISWAGSFFDKSETRIWTWKQSTDPLFESYHADKNVWAATWQNQQNGCASSEDSDQPGHLPSLIRVFAVRMKKAWVLSYPLSAERRLWSDWADAQADLSLQWAHTHFVGFVMSWLIYRHDGHADSLSNVFLYCAVVPTFVSMKSSINGNYVLTQICCSQDCHICQWTELIICLLTDNLVLTCVFDLSGARGPRLDLYGTW